MRINWSSLYSKIYHNLTAKQKVDLELSLCCLERTIDILDCCTNILDDLKGNTLKEEYEFVERIFKDE